MLLESETASDLRFEIQTMLKRQLEDAFWGYNRVSKRLMGRNQWKLSLLEKSEGSPFHVLPFRLKQTPCLKTWVLESFLSKTTWSPLVVGILVKLFLVT